MSQRTDLLNRLKKLPAAQFEELVFRLEGSYPDLHSYLADQTHTEHAIALLRFLEPHPGGWRKLENTLRDIGSSGFTRLRRSGAGIFTPPDFICVHLCVSVDKKNQKAIP